MLPRRPKSPHCLLCGLIPQLHGLRGRAKHVYVPSSRGTQVIIGLYQLQPGDIVVSKNAGGTVTIFRGGVE